MTFLKVIEGSSTGQILSLAGGIVVLGRHPSCQIVLDNASVSRQHAKIVEEDGIFLIEDLRSRNGTQVNRQSIRGRTVLNEGDEVRICDYAFTFTRHASGPAVSVMGDSRIIAPSARESLRRPVGSGAEEEPEGELPPPESLSGSSILASIGTSDQGLRLNVRPEAKLRAILEITTSLGKVLKLSEILPVILKTMFKIFPQADYGYVILKDQKSDKLRIRASHSRRPDDDSARVSMTVVRQAMETGQAILSADTNDDRRFENSESIAEMRLRSLICTPLMDTDGEPLGVLQLSTQHISQPFNSDDLDLLVSIGTQAAMAVENGKLHESLLKQRDLERDMEIAAQVQQSFLPASSPIIVGYEFADYYEAAQRIGGDYFDYFIVPDGRLAIVIGDVSGKGIPAALLMARLHSSCRHFLSSAGSAENALNKLNFEMSNSGLGYRFITLAVAFLDSKKHELQFASAGHLPPIIRRSNNKAEFFGVNESGMPLGVAADQKYKSFVVKLEPEDTVVFYTDGITEAVDGESNLFGKERVRTTVESGPESVVQLVPALIDAVELFREGRPQRDDICVTALRRII